MGTPIMDMALFAYRNAVIEGLCAATSLVGRWREGNSTLREFLREYGNHYYAEALDGREADENQKKVLAELSDFIELHKEIQYDVVDAVYLGAAVIDEELEELGRISIGVAEKRLIDLCLEYDIEDLISRLTSMSV